MFANDPVRHNAVMAVGRGRRPPSFRVLYPLLTASLVIGVSTGVGVFTTFLFGVVLALALLVFFAICWPLWQRFYESQVAMVRRRAETRQ